MDECVFCKIVKGEIPCHKVWEDEDYFAFMDVFPVLRDQIILIPKKHISSYLFNQKEDFYSTFLLKAKELVSKIDSSLKPIKTGLMVEGLEEDHVHIKLFPFYDKKGFKLKTIEPSPSKEELEKTVRRIRGG